MKSKLLILIAAAGLLFTATSCKDYLDVNHNPNQIEEINPENVLPSAQLKVANPLMAWDFGFAGAYWVQYWTQNPKASQFKTLCDYGSFDFATTYIDLTAGALADLAYIQKQTAEDPDAKGLWYIAEAMNVFTWQMLTDVWGDIPYFEAIKGSEGLLYPKFDSQQSIYSDLIRRVDDLLAMDVSKQIVASKFDFIFGGDMGKWEVFVTSLKLKLMHRLSETSAYDNAAVLAFAEKAIGEGKLLLSSNAQVSGSIWANDQEGKRHPMREYQLGDAGYFSTNVIACKSFLDFLIAESDPRLDKLFTAPSSGHKAPYFGDYESTADCDGNGTSDKDETYTTVNMADNLPLVFISAWEMNFDVAELYFRAGNMAKAKEYYEAGVKASLKQHGISDTKVLSSPMTKWDAARGMECIGQQRWVAFAHYQHLEAWLERNRTKYPSVNDVDVQFNRKALWTSFPVGQLTISVRGRAFLGGQLPQSAMYPDAVRQRNPNAPGQKPNVGAKVWWNQNVGK